MEQLEVPDLMYMFDDKVESCRYNRPSLSDTPFRSYPKTFGDGYILPEHRDKYLTLNNPIPFFDNNITFYEQEHGYVCFNRVTSASVSGVLKPYLKPFDAFSAISMMQKRCWPQYKYVLGAVEVSADNPVTHSDAVVVHDMERDKTTFSGMYGDIHSMNENERVFTYDRPMTNEEIVDIWSSPVARNLGTEGHLMMENFFNGEVIYNTPEVIAGLHFVREQMPKIGAKGFRCEFEIYGPEEDLAGSIDFLGYSPCTNKYWIFDWKRAKHLQKIKGFNNIKFFSHITESDVGKYTFQLGIYAYIIQKYTDMKIDGLALVSILPDTNWWTWCPYLKYEIEYLMRKRRELVAARLALTHIRPDLPRCCHSGEVAYDAVVDEDGKVWNSRTHDIFGTSKATPNVEIRNTVNCAMSNISPVDRSVEEENLKHVKKFLDMVPLEGVREYKCCYDF